jgi:Flp pilus assembly pilin Flp
MTRSFDRLIADERGATAIEYAIMASLVAMAIFGTLGALGATVLDLYGYVAAGGIEASTLPAAGAP